MSNVTFLEWFVVSVKITCWDAPRVSICLLVKKEIESLKDRINASIYQIKVSEKKNFDDLVSFYSQLGSENALKIINQFDDLYLAKLLYLMDTETKLQFFEKITQQSPARAKKLLEMLRKFIPTWKAWLK